MRRIGIIGGSYNPLHDGHVHIMDEAYKHIGLDEVWMWVSHNIFKDPSVYAPLPLRMEMCEERTAGKPWLKACDFETAFHDTRTASSMTTLKEMFPETEFIWVFGDDNFATFHNWDDHRFKVNGQTVPDWQYIMHHFSVAVMYRDDPEKNYRQAAKTSIASNYGASMHIEDPQNLSKEKIGWSFVNNTSAPLSSTKIKEDLLAGAKDIKGLTPFTIDLIRKNKLYGLADNFQSGRQSYPKKNDVRFAAFPMLANTMNLVKTLSAHHLPDVSTKDYKDHFAACWDKSAAKGDFQKIEDVPGEIADCMISLSWVANLLQQDLNFTDAKRETQKSTAQWCDEHFPGRGLKQRLLDYTEELAELAVCEGLEKHRAEKIIDLIFAAPDLADPRTALKTNLEKLTDYADAMDQDLGSILDKKMHKNRARTLEQSATREASKRAIIQSIHQEPEPEA